MSFLDIDDDSPGLPAVVSEITDLEQQAKSFKKSWAVLSARQQRFLQTMEDNHFSERRSAKALNDTTQSYRRWHQNDDYALCLDILRRCASGQILKKEPLIIRHNELVESLMTEKPVLYQGQQVYNTDGTPLMEIEAGAAAKVNMDLIELGGHKPKEDQKVNFGHGPALVIQLTDRVGGEVIREVKVGVIPELPAPSWMDVDDGT